jgi:hypothetical protein
MRRRSDSCSRAVGSPRDDQILTAQGSATIIINRHIEHSGFGFPTTRELLLAFILEYDQCLSRKRKGSRMVLAQKNDTPQIYNIS